MIDWQSIQVVRIRCTGRSAEQSLMIPALAALRTFRHLSIGIESDAEIVDLLRAVVAQDPDADAGFHVDRTIVLGPMTPALGGHRVMDFAEALGVSSQVSKDWVMAVSDSQQHYARQLLIESGRRSTVPLVGVAVGGGVGDHGGDPDQIAAALIQLRDRVDVDVVVLAISDLERAAAARISGRLSAHVLGSSEWSVMDYQAIIAQCDVVVGGESAMVHIASFLKRPVVGIYPMRVVKPEKWGPWGTRCQLLTAEFACSKSCVVRGCPLTRCTEAMTPERVGAAIQSVLAGQGDDSERHLAQASHAVMIIVDADTQDLGNRLASHVQLAGFPVVVVSIADPALARKIKALNITRIHLLARRRRWVVRLGAWLVMRRQGTLPRIVTDAHLDKDYYDAYIR